MPPVFPALLTSCVPMFSFTSREPGLSSFRVGGHAGRVTLPVGGAMRSSRPTIAARRADTYRGYKKTSHRVSMEAVRNALLETRREANAVALPLPSAVQLETSHISIDDRFAAQIVYAAGRCPPMVRLLSCLGSFHFSFRIEVVYTGITKSPYCGNCRSWDISFIPSVLD